MIIIAVLFMFLGINMFWALLRAHSRSLASGLGKNEPKLGPKNIYAQRHKLFCFTIMQNIVVENTL